MDERKKSGFKASCIFWALFLAIIGIAYIASYNTIVTALVETDFFNLVFGKEPAYITQKAEDLGLRTAPEQPENVQPEEPDVPHVLQPQHAASAVAAVPAEKQLPEPAAARQKPVFAAETDEEVKQKQENLQKSLVIDKKAAATADTEDTATAQTARQTPVLVCFVAIDSDGTVIRKETEKRLPYTKAPLTAAIHTLLKGPEISETEKGCMSLIPPNVKLLSATIDNRVASLNFSEEFLYNKFGVEGYLGQLMQIVYTATAFTTIDSVQFFINGQKREYLGSEGVWIGSPLARSSFK